MKKLLVPLNKAMKRVSLTCFSPFLLRKSSSPSININETPAIFASLMPDLQTLEKSLEEHSISLQWCTEAMVVLKKMHSELLRFIEKSKVPISGDGVDGLVDEYMNATLHILDMFNMFTSATSGFSSYRLMVDIAVKNIRKSDCIFATSTTNAEIQRLKEESKKVYGAERWKKMNLSIDDMPETSSTSSHAFHMVKGVMNIVTMLIFSAILYPTPINIEKEIYRVFSHDQLKPFLESIERLVDSFTKRVPWGGDDSRVALVESQMVEVAIMDAQAQVTKEPIAANRDVFVKSLESIEQSSKALKEGLGMFDSARNEVFEEMLKGRNKVIEMIKLQALQN